MKKIFDTTGLSRRDMLGSASKLALSATAAALLVGNAAMAAERAANATPGRTAGVVRRKDFKAAEDWVTAFFDKGADVVLGFYADKFVWEDVEFGQTITTREELLEAFKAFNNSGPSSPFGVHKFTVISYDGGVMPPSSKPEIRTLGAPKGWDVKQYERLSRNILLGADFEYDEIGYMQWLWQAGHNADFFGIPAKGQTTYTRGTTTQCYKNGKIVRCRTHWNFREFAMQLGMIPSPGDTWRALPHVKPAAK